MDIREIVRLWLEQNGYDGLYWPWLECGCFLDDLMPCDEPSCRCTAGFAGVNEDGNRVIQAEAGKEGK